MDQRRKEDVQGPKCGVIASGRQRGTFLQVPHVQSVSLVLETLETLEVVKALETREILKTRETLKTLKSLENLKTPETLEILDL